MMETCLVIITGGIGSGKSVVSRIVEVMGFPTYDCDSVAKSMMNENVAMRENLIRLLGPDTYGADGMLNRQYVGERIFSNQQLRQSINSIVHPAVREDLRQRVITSKSPVFFAETALLGESGLQSMAHVVWVVDAPVDVRVERVMKRSGLSAHQVLDRIASQYKGDYPGAKHIINDGQTSLLHQVTHLLEQVANVAALE